MTSTVYFGITASLLLGFAFVVTRLLPTYRRQRPMRGLGDLVALVLISLGIKDWEGCGCDERRMAWNHRWPRRWWLRDLLRNAREAYKITEDRRERLRQDFEAFKVTSLGLLSRLHESCVKDGGLPWYVAGPMPEVTELFLREGVGFRSPNDAAATALKQKDEAVEPRDYSSRR
jgi:hypothetical protein